MAENPDERSAENSALIARVSAVLREPVEIDPSFEARIMSQVRSEGARVYPVAPSPSWWRRPMVVKVNPVAGLALAAGIAGILAVSTLRSDRAGAADTRNTAATATTRTDTVHVVRFVFVDPRATSVELVGDFNGWSKGVTRLDPSGAPGVWSVSVALPAGRHEYAFIINGSRWIADPLAARSSDEFGTESSVIRVGSVSQSTT